MTDEKKISNGVNIKILGTGCPNCQKLEANVKKALEELKMEAQVEKITDIQDIMGYGIMSMPALIVNEKVLIAGIIPTMEEIKKLLMGDNKVSKNKVNSCSCSSGCC